MKSNRINKIILLIGLSTIFAMLITGCNGLSEEEKSQLYANMSNMFIVCDDDSWNQAVE